MCTILELKNKCTGCSACFNACPTHALKMIENEQGFIYPNIDENLCVKCGLCNQVCPIINKDFSNNDSPDVYAFSSEENLLKKSSTGGIFTILSENIFRLNGIVSGVKWSNLYSASHTIINQPDDLEVLRYSKYVQSEINDIYIQIKNILNAGRYVLFTGTPCQVAGLKSYLHKDYEKLITVDLLCHGVPSSKMLKDHLEETCALEKIEEICFRIKNGWGSCLDIYLKDGQIIHGTNQSNPFMKGFLNNFTLRPS